jgi:hypothetical protein
MSGNACAFWIERLKDADGTPNVSGINIFSATSGTNSGTQGTAMQLLPASGAAYPATISRATSSMQASGTTYNENIGLFPIYPNQGYAGNPDMGGLLFTVAELDSSGTVMTVNIYGGDHDFVLLTATNISGNSNTTCNIMVRCE